ncbi:MAG: hypothetical protein ABIR94_19835 [Rubrivivax sp.]
MLEPKKRHVESVTRLPTERLATACWDFIVVKSTCREAAPALVFGSLQATNIEIYQQVINNSWGLPGKPDLNTNAYAKAAKNAVSRRNSMAAPDQSRESQF